MDRIERIKHSFDIRKINHNDTHDYIQHHDPDHFKSKDHKKTSDDWSDHDEDLTDISVQSLIIFLEGLKKDQSPGLSEPKNPENQTINAAIKAYDKSSETPLRRYTYLDEGTQDIDVETVDTLINDLRHMLERDIAHITLIPADGFLESIEITVAKINAM